MKTIILLVVNTGCTKLGYKENIMVSFLGLIFIGIFWTGHGLSKSRHKDAPPIKDMNMFAKETIGMSAKDIKYGLKSGKW